MRYYGYYSNVSRGKRKKEKPKKQEIIALDPQPLSKELKKRWSYFIRKVYETDPLICPKCQGSMGTRMNSYHYLIETLFSLSGQCPTHAREP